jgi:LysR family glycine cleavage system transcriptional activator
VPPKLPPSAALRAFEAAARHGSFASAAVELHITPSAVSHQLRYLEELWQVQLFKRGRKLTLTDAGKRLAPIVRTFLDNLQQALSELQSPGRIEPLKVSLTQSFAVKWLLPRLPGFAAASPSINVWISTTDELARFDVDDVDIAIRLGSGTYDGLCATPLLREYVFPVASPDLIRRIGHVSSPQDLLRYPLILRSGKDSVPRWEFWFDKVGLKDASIPAGPRLPDTNMTIEAALAGHGAALVRSAHITSELAEGRLEKLFHQPVASPLAYHFVCSADDAQRSSVVQFREWIVAEAVVAQELYDARDGKGPAIPVSN